MPQTTASGPIPAIASAPRPVPELAKAAVAPRISSSHDGAALRGPVRFCALLGAQAKRRTDREFSIHHLAVVQVFGIEHRRAASAAASNSARAAR